MASKRWLLVQWLDEKGAFTAFSSYSVVSVNTQAFNDAGLGIGHRTFIRVSQQNAPQKAKILYISENKTEVQEQRLKVEREDQQIQRVIRSFVGNNENRDNLRLDNIADDQHSKSKSTPQPSTSSSSNQKRSTLNANNSSHRSIISSTPLPSTSARTDMHYSPQNKHQQSTSKQTRETSNANDNQPIISLIPLPSTSARTDIPYSPHKKYQQSTSKQTQSMSNANDNRSIISFTPLPSTSARTDVQNTQNKHQQSTSKQTRDTSNAYDNLSITSRTPLPSTSARIDVQYTPQIKDQQSTSKQTQDRLKVNNPSHRSTISSTPPPKTSAQKNKKTHFDQGSQTDSKRRIVSLSDINLLERQLLELYDKMCDLVYGTILAKKPKSTSTSVGDQVSHIEQNVDEQNVAEQNEDEQNVGGQNVGGQNVSEQNVSEQNVSEQNVSEQNVSEQDVSEQNVSEQDVSEENVSEQNVSEQNVGEHNVGEDNVGEHNVGEHNVGEQNAGAELNYFDNEEIGAEEEIENNDGEQQADLDLDQNAEQESNPSTRRFNRMSAQSTSNIEHNMVPIGQGHARVPERLLIDIDWSMYTLATKRLLLAVFSRSVLATHSLTGKRSPANSKKPAKKKLDPKLVEDIVDTVSTNCDVTKKTVRNCISRNCTEEARLHRKRLNKKKGRNPWDENDENISPSSSSSSSSDE